MHIDHWLLEKKLLFLPHLALLSLRMVLQKWKNLWVACVTDGLNTDPELSEKRPTVRAGLSEEKRVLYELKWRHLEKGLHLELSEARQCDCGLEGWVKLDQTSYRQIAQAGTAHWYFPLWWCLAILLSAQQQQLFLYRIKTLFLCLRA